MKLSKALFSFYLALFVAGCGGGNDGGAPHSPAAANATTLSSSLASLALTVSGAARTITLTNTGSSLATSVGYTVSPALPAGTIVAPASCGDIAPGTSCVLTVTPGATPSAAPGDTSPVPVTLSIAGANTNTLAPTVGIVTFGSVFQSGYVFAIDDTTPATGGIGGKVAALTDQSTAVIWSSDGSGGVAFDDIAGTNETSTNPPDACNGNTDGACNSATIAAFYPAVNPSFYAGGLCRATIGGYSDWYLPAICEMGYATGSATGCGTSGIPTLQNMQSKLVENGNIGGLSGTYWASTQYAALPVNASWYQDFATGGGSFQGGAFKSNMLSVRCSRAITP